MHSDQSHWWSYFADLSPVGWPLLLSNRRVLPPFPFRSNSGAGERGLPGEGQTWRTGAGRVSASETTADLSDASKQIYLLEKRLANIGWSRCGGVPGAPRTATIPARPPRWPIRAAESRARSRNGAIVGRGGGEFGGVYGGMLLIWGVVD